MAAVTQDNRLLKIDTPLGKDVLLIESFRMSEAVSRPYVIHAEVFAELTKAAQVTGEALIGKDAVITMQLPEQKERFFHGIVQRLSYGGKGTEERFVRFQLEIVPKLSRLALRTDCRIFQDKTVPDIVKKLLGDAQIEFREALKGSYSEHDYCVQYREPDLNFISRLLEEEGIYYFFEHKKDKHVLVLADSSDAHDPCPGQAKANYQPEGGFDDPVDSVLDFTMSQQLRPGSATLRDHHFRLPDKTLEFTEISAITVGENSPLEIYDYPGEYAHRFDSEANVEAEGQKITRIRMEQWESTFKQASGSSDVRAFVSGYKFSLERHFYTDFNIPWFLLSVEHSAVQSPSYVSNDPVPHAYVNNFTCIPDAVPFRPERVTEKPVVKGPHTAVVTGPPGEEIWPDKFGRVKVQFFWDRLGKKNDETTCWIRVAQPWAGKNWGMIFHPRIGHEVVVAFLEGDPDQPLIVGSAYNADHIPPFKLPDKKTQTGIATRSTREGTPKMFNMLRFDDEKGKEQVLIRSQKRGDIRILGSMYETIHANRHLIVGFPDGTEKGGSLTITVGGDNDNHVEGQRHTNIDGTETLVAGGNVMHDFHADYTCLVNGKLQLNAPDIVIEASNKIGLTVGGNSIVIDKSGVQIVGMMVKINSGGAGPFVTAPDIEDALDAVESDNGEHGYLDRPRSGGGGGGRRRRSANVHHAINLPVTRRADGALQVGAGIVIRGDQDFEEKALRDLSRMDTTTTGQDRLNRIDGSGQTVTIERGASNVTRPDNPSDAAGPGNRAIGDPPGVNSGTGNGTGSTISYDPDREPPTAADPTVNRPSDVALNHEMSHAVNNAEGTVDAAPDPANPNNPTINETRVINEDNNYRDERGIPRRADHTVL